MFTCTVGVVGPAVAFSALTLLVGHKEEHLAIKNWVMGTGMVFCLARGAVDLHMVLLMALPPVICFIKIQNSLPLWCWHTQSCPVKRLLNGFCCCYLRASALVNGSVCVSRSEVLSVYVCVYVCLVWPGVIGGRVAEWMAVDCETCITTATQCQWRRTVTQQVCRRFTLPLIGYHVTDIFSLEVKIILIDSKSNTLHFACFLNCCHFDL